MDSPPDTHGQASYGIAPYEAHLPIRSWVLSVEHCNPGIASPACWEMLGLPSSRTDQPVTLETSTNMTEGDRKHGPYSQLPLPKTQEVPVPVTSHLHPQK
jgi:hypothetical protein